MKDVLKFVIAILIILGILTFLIVAGLKGLLNWITGGSLSACLIAVVVLLIITEHYK